MPTIFEKLQNAKLPVTSATETGEITSKAMSKEQKALFDDILLEHFNPPAFQELLLRRADLKQYKDTYLSTINTLEQIENATSPTNAQVIAAIKQLAKTQKLLLKLLYSIIPMT